MVDRDDDKFDLASSANAAAGTAIAAAGFKARGVRTETETVEFARRPFVIQHELS